MSHRLVLEDIAPVTHDVNRLRFSRPEGYNFTPGQATDLTLIKDGWTDEERPFTFVSLPDQEKLEFVIKSYPSHDGVTEQIGRMAPGDAVEIGDPWGTIEDKGAGVFIAGGAGVTPFISILRNRARKGELEGCTLIFSNKTERDIILRDEFEAMKGLTTIFTVTGQEESDLPKRMIDKDFLEETVSDFSQPFYVCGPPEMVDDVSSALKELGAEPDGITFEE